MERVWSEAYFYEGFIYAFLHSIILLNTESWFGGDGVVSYPAVAFFVPVPPFISPSNGRPNIRLLRVQGALHYLFSSLDLFILLLPWL